MCSLKAARCLELMQLLELAKRWCLFEGLKSSLLFFFFLGKE